jgi:hypothetical protein
MHSRVQRRGFRRVCPSPGSLFVVAPRFSMYLLSFVPLPQISASPTAGGPTYLLNDQSGDQGKPGEPGHRNASAEVLVGPPWRMVSNAGQQQWYEGYPCTPDGGPMGHSPGQPFPPPHPPLQSASEGIGGARGLGNLVRPESLTYLSA